MRLCGERAATFSGERMRERPFGEDNISIVLE